MAQRAGSSILDFDDVVSPETYVDDFTIEMENAAQKLEESDDEMEAAISLHEQEMLEQQYLEDYEAAEHDSESSILKDLQAEIGAARASPARQANIARARARAAARLRQVRAQRARTQQARARLHKIRTERSRRAALVRRRAALAAAAAAAATAAAAKAAPNDPAKQAAADAAAKKAEEAKNAADQGDGGEGGGGDQGDGSGGGDEGGGGGDEGGGGGSGEEGSEAAAPTAPEGGGGGAEAPAQDDGGGAEAAPAQDAGPEQNESGEDMTQAPQENIGAAPHEAIKGVWLKTHIYQEGPYLKSITYCVAGGETEVLRFQVDLRPIAKRVAAYHRKLHQLEDQKRARPGGLKSHDEVSGFFDDIVSVVTAPVRAIAHLPVIGDAVKAIGRSKLVQHIAEGVGSVVKKAVSIGTMLSPYNLAKHLISGERIDHALLGDLKDKLQGLKDVAPYVQTVTSFIPGIGSGVAAAIAASTALAEGHKLTDAFISAARGIIPGGPIAQAAFDTAAALVQGRPIDKALLEAAKAQAMAAAGHLAGEVGKAFDLSTALHHAKILQTIGSIPLPSIHLGGTLSGISERAMAAYATANAALHTMSHMEDARKAVNNVVRANLLVDRMNKAAAAVGPARAKLGLAQNPDLKARVMKALAVKKAGKHLSLPHIQNVAAKRNLASNKIKQIHEAAKKGDHQAQLSMRVLNIVAQNRQRLAAVASAHSQGIPGMMIDAQGRLVKGNFVKKGDGPSQVIYSHSTEHGSFVPAIPNPAAPLATNPLARFKPAMPARHAAVVHPPARPTPGRPMPSRPPARPAARPAMRPGTHPAPIPHRVSGPMPTLVGCPPHVGYQSTGYGQDVVGCPPVPRVGYQSAGYHVGKGSGPGGHPGHGGMHRPRLSHGLSGMGPWHHGDAGRMDDFHDDVGSSQFSWFSGAPVSIVATVTPQGSAIDEALASMNGVDQAYVGAEEHGMGPMHKLLVRQRKIRAALAKMQQGRLMEISAEGGDVQAARAHMHAMREKLRAQQKRSRELLQHRLRQHHTRAAHQVSGEGLGWSDMEALASGLGDPSAEDAVFGGPWQNLLEHQKVARHAMHARQVKRIHEIKASGANTATVANARQHMHSRWDQLIAAQHQKRQALRERLAHQH